MSSLLKNEKLNEKKLKYLVIDDEIAQNNQERQNFVKDLKDLGLSRISALFAANCEDALSVIKQNSEILFCFLDCRLPENQEKKHNYYPEENIDVGISEKNIDAGINLIPRIFEINNNLPIIIFSAYVDKNDVKKITSQYSSKITIIEYLNKDEPISKYFEAVKKTLKYLDIPVDSLNSEIDKTSNNTQETQDSFDYEQLSAEVQLLVKERFIEIRKLLRRSAQDVFNVGKYLTEVKQNLEHGQFYLILKSELKWSPTSAVRFMKVYEKFKPFNLDDLNIVPSALYELTYDAIPDEVLEKTIESARLGESITLEAAKSIKKIYQKGSKTKGSSSNLDRDEISSANVVDNLSDKSLKPIIDPRSTQKSIFDVEKPKPSIIIDKQNIVKVISPQRVWHLGKHEQHTVVCQDPNSLKFMEQLPSEISLCLSFPTERLWRWNGDCYKSKSYLDFYSEYQDIDNISLLKSIENILEITTNARDNIVVCFIPDPGIISVIEAFKCYAFIADPNRSKCLALVDAGKKMTIDD